MARVFTDGAEMADALFWTYNGGVSAVAAAPAPAYSAYCYKIPAGSCYKSISAISEFYIRERILMSVAIQDSTRQKIPAFRNSSTLIADLSTDGTGKLQAYVNNVSVGVGSIVLNNSQWYDIEIHFKMADAGGIFQVYLDGVLDIDYTGDTKPGGETTIDNIFWDTGGHLGGSNYIAFDDLALNDTTGGSDDGYPGDGVIIKVTPDGNGTDNNWHGSDGNDVDNYALVDEYPNDGDTTYVYHDGADSGTQDQYTLSDYDGTDKTITRVYPEARIRKTAASAHTVKLGLLASGGADEMSAARNLSTTYARVVGDEFTLNPVDSGAWEEADIDALEFIVEVG